MSRTVLQEVVDAGCVVGGALILLAGACLLGADGWPAESWLWALAFALAFLGGVAFWLASGARAAIRAMGTAQSVSKSDS